MIRSLARYGAAHRPESHRSKFRQLAVRSTPTLSGTTDGWRQRWLTGTYPTVAAAMSGAFRRMLRKNELSAEVREVLEHNLLLLEARAGRGARPSSRPIASAPSSGDVLTAIAQLQLSPQGEGFAPHKPLLLLWALVRLLADPEASRLVRFAEMEPYFASTLTAVIEETRSPSLEEPFWRLQRDRLLWQVPEGSSLGWPNRTDPPSGGRLREAGARGGFPVSLDMQLRVDPRLQSQVASALLKRLSQPYRQRAISSLGLLDLGLELGEVADRSEGLQAVLEATMEALREREAPDAWSASASKLSALAPDKFNP